ncbi:aldehyde dehydrogenase-like protein [Gordonia polyisoprenivorans VH2]|uniref:Aldehyde dehydrogenase-like protein n=1 Tax=Gordonia polyisoprenivorans (strain DSM 44266 / VH2) TaxID=1112204 RepID=H6MWQ7_GORPV|nr:NAD-dependent succinate-semialdehyde dehydrogenase [Gordonia polyisoprenivorans]AFA75468.1 aldehyde dehydrogenase-like protein [Gordonia polyisoprenivorans VH2]OZC32387.1 NADP-dependent succinic semialdehyde dehydrogenase [Gordonia polyisoprenivorans]UZF55776.1 NAD-dependent succinate-semialdehyde dehydrogenase [Gordonia polyisoprenivorans]
MTTSITTVNPASGAVLAEYAAMSGPEIDAILERAAAAQKRCARADDKTRGDVLRVAAGVLRRRSDELAVLVTREMGKPLRESAAEVEKCALGLEYYAEHAPEFLADEPYETSADRSWVSYEPVGVVLAIMPWNFPLWQVFRFAAPALMAGNAALLKHSPNTTGAALACQEVLESAGLEPGLFTTLLVAEPDVPATTERLIADPRIGAVTITGSERAGSAVGSLAGREIKKSVLELGGSDPFVVLADAELDKVAHLAARGRFLNAGQSCISPKRFIVDASIADEFTRLLVDNVVALSVGDPEDPATDVGPMAREDLLVGVDRQVRSAIDAGARVLAGAHRLDRPGFFYAPTILTDVTKGMSVYEEETFGPVATIITVDGVEEAIDVANDIPFGLGASVWGRDVDAAIDVGRRIESGACFINAIVASDPRMPFGGTKRSGYGRELAAPGIREFVNIRTWWAMTEPTVQAPSSE